MNGNVEGDEEGEWTYTGGRGNSVIDYILGNEDTRERVERMEVAERVESDHHPVVVWLKGGCRGGGGKGKKGGGKRVGKGEMDGEGERGIRKDIWEERWRGQRNTGRMEGVER